MSLRCRIFLLTCLAILGFGLSATMCRAQFFPTGVVGESMLAGSSLTRPMSMEFLPDGRVLIAEHHSGRIRSWSRGALRTIGTVENLKLGIDHGLVSIAIDPEFRKRPFIYCYFVQDSGGGVPEKRIVRYRLTGDLSFQSHGDLSMVEPYEIITGIPAPIDIHNGGGFRFGSDGCLYLALGDAGMPSEAQNVNSAFGKILRMDVRNLPTAGPPPAILDLVPPGGNPFANLGSSDISQLVFAMGLRNPFRMTNDPDTGLLIVADVGENSWEEINFSSGGENFGWPWFEGASPFSTTLPGPVPTNLTLPALAGPHGPPLGFTAVVPFGGLYRNQGGRFDFGPDYEGDLLVADLGIPADIFRLKFGGNGWSFAAGLPGQPDPKIWGLSLFPTDTQIGPDGAFWQTAFVNGDLIRTRPEAGGTTLLITGGQSQVGNAGTLSSKLLEVELSDLNNQPLRQEEVFFTIECGGGSMQTSVFTDSLGRAQLSYRFADKWTGENPEIVVYHPGSTPKRFSFEWRGLEAIASLNHKHQFRFRHSAAQVPVLALADLMPNAAFANVPSGEIWTSLLAPLSSLIVVGDGFGLYGPVDPDYLTDAAGQRLVVIEVPPGLGGELVIQAYALDPARSGVEELTISNPITLPLRK